MKGTDVFRALKRIKATSLYHANSVTASATFLEQGGLASRAFVERHALKQTPQKSDNIDKKYGIWDCVFLDHFDIHRRAMKANHYGPVLFVFELDLLLTLPVGTDIFVTKTNPIHWNNQPQSERYFLDVQELSENISFKNYGQMLIIRTPSGIVDFPNRIIRTREVPNRGANIILDDPQRTISSGEDARTNAEARLKDAVRVRNATLRIQNVAIKLQSRRCASKCECKPIYREMTTTDFDCMFT